MKTFKSVLLVLTIYFFAFTSCVKETDTIKAEASTSAKVDGTVKAGIDPVAATLYQDENALQVMIMFSNTEGISLMINDVMTGDFDVANTEATVSYMNGIDPENTYLGETGTVKITSLTDDTISGTFEFTAKNLGDNSTIKVITEGKFEANITRL